MQICTDLKRSRALPGKARRRVLPVTPLTAADFNYAADEELGSAGTPRVDWSQQFDAEGRATGVRSAAAQP